MVHATQASRRRAVLNHKGSQLRRSSRNVLVLRAVAIAVTLGALVAIGVTGSVPSTGRVREFGDSLGGVAPFVWPFVLALINLLVPWPITAGATGLLFGTALGTPLALAGVLIQAVIQFVLARSVAGEDLRERVLARVPRISAALERNGFLAAFYSRIVPGVPWGIVNLAVGLSRVRLTHLLLATLVGGSPKVFAYVALGGSFGDLDRPEAIVAIALLAVLAVGGLVLARRGVTAREAP